MDITYSNGRSVDASREARRKWYYANLEQERAKQRVRTKQKRERNKGKQREYLEGKSCIVCGEARAVCLDFHHRDPATKRFSVTRALKTGSCSKESLDAEIAKCDILCANCHRVAHDCGGVA